MVSDPAQALEASGARFVRIVWCDNANVIRAKAVHATNLVLDSDSLTGDEADFTNINIAQDASTLTQVPSLAGPLGVYGQQSDHVTITNVKQHNWASTAATFSLPNLSMGFSDTGCGE